MGLFDDILEDDANFAFTDTDTFGETATLIFPSGTTRTVDVQIDRQGLAARTLGEGITAVLVVSIKNTATRGLLLSEWNNNLRLTITNPHPGVSTYTYKLPPWTSQDAGMLTFEISRDG